MQASYFEPPLPPVSTIHATCSMARDVIPLRRQDSPDSGIGKDFSSVAKIVVTLIHGLRFCILFPLYPQ